MHGPRLLVLDEATSALDPEAEAAICATLLDLRGELTVVAVTHRPALARAADVLFVVTSEGVRAGAPA